jgi:ribosome-binding protein aMBF1 (putative translation factor)
MTIPFRELKKRWMKDPGFRTEYDALESEFAVARQLIEARSRAGLSQQELADRMGTTQPVIARLESGRQKPTTKTLERFAKATGSKVEIRLVAVS